MFIETCATRKLGYGSYSHFIVTMAVSLAVCEISSMTLKTGLGFVRGHENGAVR